MADPVFTYTTTSTLLGFGCFTGSLTGHQEKLLKLCNTQGTLALDSNYLINYTPAALKILDRPSAQISGDIHTSKHAPSPEVTYHRKGLRHLHLLTISIRERIRRVTTTEVRLHYRSNRNRRKLCLYTDQIT
ncbi:hypothetical protein CS542_04710 [Pedobacter sp. IW39]|nr:hypothetical protein CS542_04710 [Pedobacter sp. IW39]